MTRCFDTLCAGCALRRTRTRRLPEVYHLFRGSPAHSDVRRGVPSPAHRMQAPEVDRTRQLTINRFAAERRTVPLGVSFAKDRYNDARGRDPARAPCFDLSLHAVLPFGFTRPNGILVDPASSHMLLSRTKPCMSKSKQTTVGLQTAPYSAMIGAAERSHFGSRQLDNFTLGNS